jgi:hypothetical protein
MPGVLSRALALRSFQGGAIIRATGPWTAVLTRSPRRRGREAQGPLKPQSFGGPEIDHQCGSLAAMLEGATGSLCQVVASKP